MKTHVFIVNGKSFPFHLKHLFAGTGAQDDGSHSGLLADIKRVREGDLVIFYLETKESVGIDGGFFGTFKIADVHPIVIHDTSNPPYLTAQLGKKLIYRVRLEPHEVYAKGVVEYKALDDLPVYSREILWSLIYRKLKALRGCTPLTLEESSRLIEMIRKENNHQKLAYSNTDGFNFNPVNQSIELVQNGKFPYTGNTPPSPPLVPIIYQKANAGKAFEVELQAYFSENAGTGINPSLDVITGNANNILWLGNEVKCGVGMRSIDLFTVLKMPRDTREFRVIELKDEHVSPTISGQLFKYVNWTSQYINGAINANIQPIVVSTKIPDSGNNRLKRKKRDANGNDTPFWQEIRDCFNSFNAKNLSMPILYFEYDFTNSNIVFNRVNY